MKYESREFAYILMEQIGRPKHIVEIGAYKPEHIVCWPFIFDPKCDILLIEPNPDVVKELHEYYKDYPNVTIHDYAIVESKISTRVNMSIPENNVCNQHADASGYIININSPYKARKIAGRYVEPINSIVVKANTFDKFDNGKIDGIVIDIEGAEWFVLQNMISRPAVLCIEMGGPANYKNPYYNEIIDWIVKNGYELHTTTHVNEIVNDYIYVKKR